MHSPGMGRANKFYALQQRELQHPGSIPRGTMLVDELDFTHAITYTKKKPSPRTIAKVAKILATSTDLGARALHELRMLHHWPQLACDVMLELTRMARREVQKMANSKRKPRTRLKTT